MPTTTRSKKNKDGSKKTGASNAGKSTKENRPRANSLSEDPATEVDTGFILSAKWQNIILWMTVGASLAAKYMT